MKKALFILSAAVALASCNEAPKTNVESHAQVESETPVEVVLEKKEIYDENGGFDTSSVTQIPITNMSATELSDLVQISARPNSGITYNGYYSMLKIDDETMLHGSFSVKSESPEMQDGIAGRSVFYKGAFYEGVRHDFWSERVRIIAAEIKEDYNITMKFDGGICENTVFTGYVNKEMKPKKIEYKGESVCDFNIVRKKITIADNIKQKAAIKN
ncbi:MAG: hypothetical protein ACI9RU_000114 [Litorivivens sp.]|jgi:hypothetical protein